MNADFRAATGGWLDAAMQIARTIFVTLIGAEVTYALIQIFLQRRSLEEFVSGLTLKIISVGAAVTVLSLAPTFIPGLLNDFMRIGTQISVSGGHAVTLSPSQVMAQGWDLAGAMNDTTENLNWIEFAKAAIPVEFGQLLVIISYSVVAGSLLLTLIESYVVVAGGAFLIMLIVGLGDSLAAKWISLFKPGAINDFVDYFAVAGDALVYCLIAWSAPRFVASMVGASPVMSVAGAYGDARDAGGQIAGATQTAARVGNSVQGAIERAASFSK
ncbi:MAG: type IV secretion system protein [Candidatus Eremiobacteraeota bacterium]|nr:type IV secretion system protein [Candidatus Eremiobacteraeota bacterium]